MNKKMKIAYFINTFKSTNWERYAPFALQDARQTSQGEWIWHNDRNSMMNSVESRSPFLDCKLHSFIHSGYQNKFHENWNKYELRKVFARFTPLPAQYRTQKQGFRWDEKHFFNENKEQIIELIRNSEVLKEYSNKDFFSSVTTQFPKVLRSSVGKRFLRVAGVEYMMNKH